MKCILALSVFVLIAISTCVANDLIVGNSFNGHLIWQQKMEYMGIPFKKRVKEAFFSDPGLNVIKAVVARDLDHTQASATITAGGVGFTFVNLRFKSERGSGLNYAVELYSKKPPATLAPISKPISMVFCLIRRSEVATRVNISTSRKNSIIMKETINKLLHC
ncbi:unnamed protein product [Chrysodeixis includens]|uniref:Uncharacterized protein n=1 Tax=Chrysodeixis includens TaxID=689277 RepID=A0A9N8KUW4_CHRIL|nr:unnamed protein product [Chrysodeixis includens]